MAGQPDPLNVPGADGPGPARRGGRPPTVVDEEVLEQKWLARQRVNAQRPASVVGNGPGRKRGRPPIVLTAEVLEQRRLSRQRVNAQQPKVITSVLTLVLTVAIVMASHSVVPSTSGPFKRERGRPRGSLNKSKLEQGPLSIPHSACTSSQHVVGKLSSYGRRETRANGAQKRDIVLHDMRNDRMVVTLWEDRAEEFMQLLSKAKDLPLCVVITGLLAKKFSGTASLSSTDSTRCYVNVDYAPIEAMREYWSKAGAAGLELLPPKEEDFVATDGNAVSELPIASILEAKLAPGQDVVRFICRAKIVGVLTGNGWFYSCCPKCAKSIRAVNGLYYCTSCAQEPGSAEQRFRLVDQVEDKTATTTFTLFNKEAEQIVGIPLRKILAEMPEEVPTSPIPPPVNNIIGRKFIFQLKVTRYNMTHGCEEFTVTRVSEEPPLESAVEEHSATAGGETEPTGNAAKKPKIA